MSSEQLIIHNDNTDSLSKMAVLESKLNYYRRYKHIIDKYNSDTKFKKLIDNYTDDMEVYNHLYDFLEMYNSLNYNFLFVVLLYIHLL